MLKNKWLWCAFSAVILIIALIFAFRSCTAKGEDASDLNGIVSADTVCGGIVGNAFNSSFSQCYNVGAVNGSEFGGGFAAVDYTSAYKNCGYSDTSAEYALKTIDGAFVTETNGISVLNSDQIG